MGLFKKRTVVAGTIAGDIQDHMRAVLEHFPGAKMTLVIRTDRLEEPLIFTNDKQEEVIAAVRKMLPGSNGLFVN